MANDKDFKVKNGLTVDSDTLVVDAANSRVGIGTTNPATPLEVYGQIRTSAAGTNYGLISGLSGAMYVGHRNDADDGAIIFGGYGGGGFTEKMRLTPDGKLGINSSSPAEALEVVSKGQYNPAIRIEDWGDSAGGAGVGWSRIDLRHSQSTSSEQGIIHVDQNMNFNLLHKDSGRDILFKTTPAGTGGSSIEAMRIRSDGKVGIGTSSPNAALTSVTDADSTAIFSVGVEQSGGGFRYLNLLSPSDRDDNNAAFRFVTANSYAFRVDATDRLTIDASGNVGIGTSSPVAQLDVKNGTTYSALGDFIARIQQNTNSPGKNGLSVMNAWANTNSTIFEAAMGWNGSAAGYFPCFTIDGTGQTIFSNGQPQQERMRLNSSGKVLIDRTTAYSDGIIGTPVLQARARTGHYAAAAFVADATSSVISIGFVNPNGLVGTISTSGSGTSYSSSSDYRLKENVVDLTGAIDRLKLIPVHRFNFIADSDTTVDGFLAHEVQPHVPEAVTGEKDAVDSDGNIKPQAIDQSKLVPLLTAAIQEQQTQIEALEARIAALESA